MSASANLLVGVVFSTANGPYDGIATTFYSDPVKGDGYFGYSDGLHTAAYFTTSFMGFITLQASLAAAPTANDWFDITGTTYGDGGDGGSPVTLQQNFNFTGNFVWIRVKVTEFTAGSIGKVTVVQ